MLPSLFDDKNQALCALVEKMKDAAKDLPYPEPVYIMHPETAARLLRHFLGHDVHILSACPKANLYVVDVNSPLGKEGTIWP